jgi:hypothetical protein
MAPQYGRTARVLTFNDQSYRFRHKMWLTWDGTKFTASIVKKCPVGGVRIHVTDTSPHRNTATSIAASAAGGIYEMRHVAACFTLLNLIFDLVTRAPAAVPGIEQYAIHQYLNP